MVSEDHVMLLLLLGSYIGCIVRKRSSLDASCGRGERERKSCNCFFEVEPPM